MSDRSITFAGWGKTARLNKTVTITEKIDGTNASIGIRPIEGMDRIEMEGCPVEFFDDDARYILAVVDGFVVYAQSRKRLISLDFDNMGFASWVAANADALVNILGPGLHFGEWWGSKIQRTYGLANGDKRFSLFNVMKADAIDAAFNVGYVAEGLDVVPLLYHGTFNTDAVERAVTDLRSTGSLAMPGFMQPEGVVVYHTAAKVGFKVLLENDQIPKSLVKELVSA